MKDIFGNEVIEIPKPTKRKPRTLFDDYEAFVDKFKPRKTTDDCYTPQAVYDCVLDYVRENVDLSGVDKILRPFYPGGDYERIEYAPTSVVIDNPPFSMIAKITQFYIKKGVRFFLFAPHMTLFSADIDCTKIVCGADVVYENGAVVKTSFLTNMFGNTLVFGDPELYQRLMAINKHDTVKLPRYRYPVNVLTVSMVQACVIKGIRMEFDKESLAFCRGLDSQKIYNKSIYGAGFLLSDTAAAKKVAAEKAAAETSPIIEWELSPREWEIIKALK